MKSCNSPTRARQWAGVRRKSEAARALRNAVAPIAKAVAVTGSNLNALRAMLKAATEAVSAGDVTLVQLRGELRRSVDLHQRAERDFFALERNIDAHWANFGPPGFYGGLRFEALPPAASQERAAAIAQVRAFGADGAPFGNLVIAGQAGTGKTTLLACKLASYDAAWQNIEFIDHAAFTRKFRDAGRGEYARLLAHYGESVEVLALDDLGAGSAGAGGEAFAAELLTDVLNLRVAHRLRTLCTTNAQPEDLCKWLGGPGGRGWSRLSGGMVWVPLVGDDLRRKDASLRSDAPPFSPRLERLGEQVDQLAARVVAAREAVELAEKCQSVRRAQRGQVAALVADSERLHLHSKQTHAEAVRVVRLAAQEVLADRQWVAAQALADHSGAISRKAVLRRTLHLQARHPKEVQYELEGCMANATHELRPEFLAAFAEQLDAAVEGLPEADPDALPTDGVMTLFDVAWAACEAARTAASREEARAHLDRAKQAADEAARIADGFAEAARGLPAAGELVEGAIAGDDSTFIAASNAETARMWADSAAAQVAEAEAALA